MDLINVSSLFGGSLRSFLRKPGSLSLYVSSGKTLYLSSEQRSFLKNFLELSQNEFEDSSVRYFINGLLNRL